MFLKYKKKKKTKKISRNKKKTVNNPNKMLHSAWFRRTFYSTGGDGGHANDEITTSSLMILIKPRKMSLNAICMCY